MTIKALLDVGTAATNYTAGCFANDINYTFGPAHPLPAGLSMKLFSDESTAQVSATEFKRERNCSGSSIESCRNCLDAHHTALYYQ